MDASDLSKLLRWARLRHNLSRRQAERKTGVPFRTIERWEKVGRGEMTRICGYLAELEVRLRSHIRGSSTRN